MRSNSREKEEEGEREKERVLSRVVIVAVAAGAHHSFALDSTGSLWSWGCGREGALGSGCLEHRLQPARVGLEPPSQSPRCSDEHDKKEATRERGSRHSSSSHVSVAQRQPIAPTTAGALNRLAGVGECGRYERREVASFVGQTTERGVSQGSKDNKRAVHDADESVERAFAVSCGSRHTLVVTTAGRLLR